MFYRLLALVCGMLIGALLRSAFLVEHPAPAAPNGAAYSQARGAAPADPRCAAHPIRMPCLFGPAP